MTFNSQYLSPSNMYVTCDLEFLVILLGKEHSSPHWYIKCKSSSKYWNLSDHSMGNELTIETLNVLSQSEENAECVRCQIITLLKFC